MLKLIPPGTGPNSEKRKGHWFEVTIIAKEKNKEVVTKIKGGDPGYEETSKFISEMALAIIIDNRNLLNNRGILTPVECAGDILSKRLVDAGISIETTSKAK